MFGKFWWFITGGQSDFWPLLPHHWSPLLAKYGNVNVGPWMEILIALCLFGAAIFIALSIKRILARRWFRAAISLIVAAAMTTAAYAASSTLSALTAASGVNGTDLFYDVQTPGTGGVQATAAQLLAYIGLNIGGYVSVGAGCGNSTGGAGAGPIVTISSVMTPVVLTGSNPPLTTNYCGQLIRLNNASNQAPTIVQAGSAGFAAGWFTTLCNIGAGTQTITTGAGTIGGASTYVLPAGSVASPACIGIVSDGVSDYNLVVGTATAAFANPTGTAGPVAVNGSATTAMRSDAAPAIQLGTSSQSGIVQVDGTTITASAGVISAGAADPCTTGTKTSVAISQTASAQLFAGTSSVKNYICSYQWSGSDAENMSLVEGTGSVCASNTAAIIGGTTAAAGNNFAANSGVAQGNGGATVAAGHNNDYNVCLFQSGSGRVAGFITYVQQ